MSKLKRWSITAKYDYYFATQYKDCFVFFGIPSGTSVAEVDDQVCTMSGCVATLVEVDKEDGYIWSPMPQLSLQLSTKDNAVRSVRMLGGFTCRDEIKVLSIITIPEPAANHLFRIRGSERCYVNNFVAKCWNTSLTKPFLCWSEETPTITPANYKFNIPPAELLVAVQKCKQYIIYCYSPKQINSSIDFLRQMNPFPESTLIITDEEKEQLCLFSAGSVTFDRHVSCAVVGADLFIISGDKMAKVEKFSHLLFANTNSNRTKKFSISFGLNVPHANGTLFVTQNTLCVVGGCDDNYEPFSEIYQFDHKTHKWNECGVCAMPRYGASVVPFTDRKDKEAVFIAGGFKEKDVPCSIIEVLVVNVKPIIVKKEC